MYVIVREGLEVLAEKVNGLTESKFQKIESSVGLQEMARGRVAL